MAIRKEAFYPLQGSVTDTIAFQLVEWDLMIEGIKFFRNIEKDTYSGQLQIRSYKANELLSACDVERFL